MKVCSLLSMLVVVFQVSEPYRRVDLTFELKICSLVLSDRFFIFQILLSMLNVALAFPILARTSSSVPPSTEMIVPRYVKLATSSSWFWFMVMGVLLLLLILITLVFDELVLSPSRAPVSSSLPDFSCIR